MSVAPTLSLIGPLTPANIIRAFDVGRMIRILNYAACTVMVWDMLLTFSREVAIVWTSRWTLVKIIFILNRYVTPATIGVNMWSISGLATGLTNDVCRGWFSVATILQSVCLSLVSLSISLRLFVLYETSKRMLYQMLTVWAVTLVAGFGLIIKLFIINGSSIVYEPFSNICVGVNTGIWVVWLPRTTEHALFCTFLVINAMYTPRSSQTPALRILYRDGILYYFATFLSLLASTLVWRYGRLLYAGFTLYTTWAFCQIAVARLMLDSRGAKLFQPRRFTPRAPGHSFPEDTPMQTMDRNRLRQTRLITSLHIHTPSGLGSQASASACSPGKSIMSLPDHRHNYSIHDNNSNHMTETNLRTEHHMGIEEIRFSKDDQPDNGDVMGTIKKRGRSRSVDGLSQHVRTARSVRMNGQTGAALRLSFHDAQATQITGENNQKKPKILSTFFWLLGRGAPSEPDTYVDVEDEDGWEGEDGSKGGIKESRLGRFDHWV